MTGIGRITTNRGNKLESKKCSHILFTFPSSSLFDFMIIYQVFILSLRKVITFFATMHISKDLTSNLTKLPTFFNSSVLSFLLEVDH